MKQKFLILGLILSIFLSIFLISGIAGCAKISEEKNITITVPEYFINVTGTGKNVTLIVPTSEVSLPIDSKEEACAFFKNILVARGEDTTEISCTAKNKMCSPITIGQGTDEFVTYNCTKDEINYNAWIISYGCKSEIIICGGSIIIDSNTGNILEQTIIT